MFTNMLVVMLSLFFLSVGAQVPFFSRCPEYHAVPNFDVVKYLGRWYEIERYFLVFEFGGKCVTADYTLGKNGEVVVTNQQLSAITGISSTIEGVANMISRSDEAKLSVSFPSLPVSFKAPYWVLDTDYDNYAIVWSCNNFGFFSTRNAWILTRSNNPSIEVMEKAYKVLDQNGISRAYFIRTDQRNCPKTKRY